MFFIYFLSVFAMSETFRKANNFESTSIVDSPPNTVYYIQVKPQLDKKLKMSMDSDEDDMDPYGEKKGFGRFNNKYAITKLFVYKNHYNQEPKLVFSDQKRFKETTFFFTAPSAGEYTITLQVIVPDPSIEELLVEYKIFNGAPNKPKIVSTNDVAVYGVETEIKDLYDKIKNNIDMQNMGEDDDDAYKQIYSEIVRAIGWFVFLKIVSSITSLAYSGWRTKKFFTTQKIGEKEF